MGLYELLCFPSYFRPVTVSENKMRLIQVIYFSQSHVGCYPHLFYSLRCMKINCLFFYLFLYFPRYQGKYVTSKVITICPPYFHLDFKNPKLSPLHTFIIWLDNNLTIISIMKVMKNQNLLNIVHNLNVIFLKSISQLISVHNSISGLLHD